MRESTFSPPFETEDGRLEKEPQSDYRDLDSKVFVLLNVYRRYLLSVGRQLSECEVTPV